MVKRSLWLCIEGIDGSGKTTQAKMLCAKLAKLGKTAAYTHVFGTPIGLELRKIFLENSLTNLEEVLLLFIARIECIKKVEKLKKNYDVVITDRWLLSIRTMQGLCNNNLDIVNILEERLNARGKPDLTIILDVNEKICRDRIVARNTNLDQIEAKNLCFHRKVRNNFLELSKTNDNTYVLDGTPDIKSVNDNIMKLVADIILLRKDNVIC